MKILHLTLARRWFDMIASGEKKQEYREISKYWIERLTWHEYHKLSKEKIIELVNSGVDVLRHDFDIVHARNGYTPVAPLVRWNFVPIKIGEGKFEWGAQIGKQYFIFEIGGVI